MFTRDEALGRDTAGATLENHRYLRLIVEVERNEVIIRKTIAAGPMRDERYPLTEARAALAASGIEDHLDANGPAMPIKVAIAIETMAKHQKTGVLYDSKRPETKDQIAFPDKHFEPGWKPVAKGRIPDFPVTRSHPPASWPSAANSSICRTYRKTAGEESRRRSPVANRWMRP